MLMLQRLPKFASDNRAKGSVDESQAIVQGSIAYFGGYTASGDKEVTVNPRSRF
jgi:hypothetical protein